MNMCGQQQRAAFHCALNRDPHGAQWRCDHWNAQGSIDVSLHPDGVDEKSVAACASFAMHAERELCLVRENVPHNGGYSRAHEVIKDNGVRAIDYGAVVASCLLGDVEHLSLGIDGQCCGVAAPELCGMHRELGGEVVCHEQL